MPVLGTKLHVPAMRRRLVPRPRLTGRLRGDPASLPRLVLVSAPAGFGKTTLVAQWLASGEQSPRVAWLSLDAEDSELRRFVTHLVAAIQLSSPRVGAEALALLESDRALPAEAVLVSLVNDLDELAGPTVLALDDYHVIDAPDIHEAVTFLLDHLPPQVTIAITTRADPPLPLARLRGRGEFVGAYVLPSLAHTAPAYVNDVLAAAVGGTVRGDIGLMQPAFVISSVGYLAGGVLFGIALFRARVLARWASGLLVLGTLATLAIPVLPHSFERPLAVPTGVALIGLGISLWRDQRKTAAVTADGLAVARVEPAAVR